MRKFGITMAIAFLVLSLIIFFKHKAVPPVLPAVSLAFLLLGMFLPSLLKPVYIAWMRLAHALAWFNTRLILCILFYLVFTPVGLFLRLLGKDLLDRKIDRNAGTYWRQREKRHLTPAEYERQF